MQPVPAYELANLAALARDARTAVATLHWRIRHLHDAGVPVEELAELARLDVAEVERIAAGAHASG